MPTQTAAGTRAGTTMTRGRAPGPALPEPASEPGTVTVSVAATGPRQTRRERGFDAAGTGLQLESGHWAIIRSRVTVMIIVRRMPVSQCRPW